CKGTATMSSCFNYSAAAALAIAVTMLQVIATSADEPAGSPLNGANAQMPSVNSSTFSQLLNQVGITAQFGRQVPLDAQFTESTGARVRLGECLGHRPTILHLVYYQCPMLCKLSTDGLLSTLSTINLKMGQDFSVVTISFDPRDGPEISAAAKKLAADRC